MRCPNVVAVLSLLAASRGLAAQPPQLTADQARVLDMARAAALQYVQQLPNFICVQITHRQIISENKFISSGVGSNGSAPTVLTRRTLSSDYFEEQLTYIGGKESYSQLMVNSKVANQRDRALLPGAISSGEFGSQLSQIFIPSSQTIFAWDRETNAHRRRVWVYKYQVPKEAGSTVTYRVTDTKLPVSISGKISIDPETGEVLEISSIPDLPLDFPLSEIERQIVYSAQIIAGKKYILPAHSEMRMKEGGRIYENNIDFKNYQHFGSESTIHYEDSYSH